LPFVLGISAVAYESLAVCNYSDGSVSCTSVVLFLTSILSTVEFCSNPRVVGEFISFKTGRVVENSMFRRFLEIHWIAVILSLGFPHEIFVLILEFLFQSTFKYL